MALRQHYWNPRTNEACFVDETQLIYAFNERQDAGTWSDLHVHPDWGELLFVATGSIVLCSETGNFLGQGYRATWVPPGVQHEWYLPEASWNRSLFFHASLFEDSPRFRQCHGLEMSPLLRELLFAVDDLKPDFTTEEGKRFALVLMDRLKASKEVGGPLLMPSEHRLVELCAAALAAPDAPICMADWSRHLGMSEKTLARLFIRQTGQTFGRWLQIMRLQHAMTEIEQGQSVTAVALDCGYNSVSAFISAFKKHFGSTPGAIAKRRHERERERESLTHRTNTSNADSFSLISYIYRKIPEPEPDRFYRLSSLVAYPFSYPFFASRLLFPQEYTVVIENKNFSEKSEFFSDVFLFVLRTELLLAMCPTWSEGVFFIYGHVLLSSVPDALPRIRAPPLVAPYSGQTPEASPALLPRLCVMPTFE